MNEVIIPLFNTIKSPYGYYIYDTNKNDILKISKKLFDCLNEWKFKGKLVLDEEIDKEIAFLKRQGYLSENKVQVIRHPKSDCFIEYQNRKINEMTLQVTQQCNLRCSYCVYSQEKNEKQRAHSSKKMSLKTAQAAVDFLLEHSIDCNEVFISFYGGEPLLEFNLIREVVEYAERVFWGKNVVFSMTTNATILTDDILGFLNQYNFRILISMDGPKDIHNKNRKFMLNGKGSYDAVLKNIVRIKEKYPTLAKRLNINMVIDPQNNFNDINQVFGKESLLNDIKISSSEIDDIYSKEKNIYSEEYITEKNYNLFLAYLAYLDFYKMDKVLPVTQNQFSSILEKMGYLGKGNKLGKVGSPSGPCIPGQTRLFVDVDGILYPCERVSECSENMRIGNIYDGFNVKKSYDLLNCAQLTSDECKECWAFRLCSICAKYGDEGDGFNKEVRLKQCEKVRQEANEMLAVKIMFDEMGKNS